MLRIPEGQKRGKLYRKQQKTDPEQHLKKCRKVA